jgi:hypothetical protein
MPESVRQAIAAHIRARTAEAAETQWSAAEEEDTLTGHFLGLLSAKERKVLVDDRAWYWSIEYAKFRSKGKLATESEVGADGIFEIRVNGVEGAARKCILFQSKMGFPSGTDAKRQAILMSNWREASVFLAYESDNVKVFSIDDILANRVVAGVPFADFFVDRYLACQVGDSDMFYDAGARTLHWRDDKGMLIAVRFPIPRRISTLDQGLLPKLTWHFVYISRRDC